MITNNAISQAREACNLAREAFAAGDQVTGIAAITLAAQLVQLARLWQKDRGAG
jgi:hypothetical protein